MNGPQDMGGFRRFGPVGRRPTNPVFHEEWERRVLALTLAMDACGQWNLDILRHARESTPALKYWSSRYYDIRIEAHIKLMIERGMISRSRTCRRPHENSTKAGEGGPEGRHGAGRAGQRAAPPIAGRHRRPL